MVSARHRNIFLFVLGLLDEMQRDGLATVTGLKMTRSGRKEYKKICQSGFRPTLGEFQSAIECLKQDPRMNVEFKNLPPTIFGGTA